MRIDKDLCIECGECVPYCTVGAIALGGEGFAAVDRDRCVECGVCLRIAVCSQDAIIREELEWPRVIRSHFSDPTAKHPSTGIMGRGTMEMKTNDVTGRYVSGQVGFGVELGRPGVSTCMADVEKVTMAVARVGVEWEVKGNPTTYLMSDQATGKLQEDVLKERVLSAIVEFKAPSSSLSEILTALKEVSREIDTVFSVSMITKVEPDGSLPNVEAAESLGFKALPNPKINVGLGRPLFDFSAKGGEVL